MTTKSTVFQGKTVTFEKTNLKRGNSSRELWEVKTPDVIFNGYRLLPGLQTDFTSFPWWTGLFLLLIKLYWKRLMVPTAYHDQACLDYIHFPTKADANKLFKAALKAAKVPFFVSGPMLWYVGSVSDKRVRWAQPNLTPIYDEAGLQIGFKELE